MTALSMANSRTGGIHSQVSSSGMAGGGEDHQLIKLRVTGLAVAVIVVTIFRTGGSHSQVGLGGVTGSRDHALCRQHFAAAAAVLANGQASLGTGGGHSLVDGLHMVHRGYHNRATACFLAADSAVLHIVIAAGSGAGCGNFILPHRFASGMALGIHIAVHIAVTASRAGVGGEALLLTGRIGYHGLILVAGRRNGFRAGMALVILAGEGAHAVLGTGGGLGYDAIIFILIVIVIDVVIVTQLGHLIRLVGITAVAGVGGKAIRRTGGSRHSLLVAMAILANLYRLSAEFLAAVRAVYNLVIAAFFGTSGLFTILLNRFRLGVAQSVHNHGLSAEFFFADSAVHNVIVAAVIDAVRINVVLNNGRFFLVSQSVHNHGLAAEFLTADLAIHNCVVAAFGITVRINVVFNNGILFLVAQSIHNDGLAGHFFTADLAIHNRFIAAFGIAVRINVVFNNGVLFLMAQRGNSDGLAAEFLTADLAIHNRVVAAFGIAIRINVVFNNGILRLVAQSIHFGGLAAHFNTAHRAIHNRVIAAFGDAIGIHVVLDHGVLLGVAQSIHLSGLAAHFNTAHRAIHNRVIAAFGDAIGIHVVLDHGVLLGVAQSRNSFLIGMRCVVFTSVGANTIFSTSGLRLHNAVVLVHSTIIVGVVVMTQGRQHAGHTADFIRLANGAIHYRFIAAVIFAGSFNPVFFHGIGCLMTRCRNRLSFRLSNLAANGAVGYQVVAAILFTGGFNTVLFLDLASGMAQRRHRGGHAAHLGATNGAVYNRVIAACVDTVSLLVIFDYRLLVGMAKSGDIRIHIAVTAIGTGMGGIALVCAGGLGNRLAVGMARGRDNFRIGVIAARAGEGLDTIRRAGSYLRNLFSIAVLQLRHSHRSAGNLILALLNRAVHHRFIAALSRTGSRNFILLHSHSGSMGLLGDSFLLAEFLQLGAALRAVHIGFVAALAVAGRLNPVLFHRVPRSMRLLLDGHSLAAEFLTARLNRAVHHRNVAALSRTGGFRPASLKLNSFGGSMILLFDGLGRAADLVLALLNRAVHHFVIAALGIASGVNLILFHSCRRSMRQAFGYRHRVTVKFGTAAFNSAVLHHVIGAIGITGNLNNAVLILDEFSGSVFLLFDGHRLASHFVGLAGCAVHHVVIAALGIAGGLLIVLLHSFAGSMAQLVLMIRLLGTAAGFAGMQGVAIRGTGRLNHSDRILVALGQNFFRRVSSIVITNLADLAIRGTGGLDGLDNLPDVAQSFRQNHIAVQADLSGFAGGGRAGLVAGAGIHHFLAADLIGIANRAIHNLVVTAVLCTLGGNNVFLHRGSRLVAQSSDGFGILIVAADTLGSGITPFGASSSLAVNNLAALVLVTQGENLRGLGKGFTALRALHTGRSTSSIAGGVHGRNLFLGMAGLGQNGGFGFIAADALDGGIAILFAPSILVVNHITALIVMAQGR